MSFRKLYGTGILLSNMQSPFANVKWHSETQPVTVIPNRSEFSPMFYLDTELGLYRITSCFHGTFVTVVARQQGTLTLPNNGSVPFWDLTMLQLLSSFPCLFLTFYFDIPRYFLNLAILMSLFLKKKMFVSTQGHRLTIKVMRPKSLISKFQSESNKF